MKITHRDLSRVLNLLVRLTCVGLVLASFGCPGFPQQPPPTNGNGNGNGNGAPNFGILNFISNIAFSDDVVLTVLYSVPSDADQVVGFLRLLNAPADSGGTPVGVEEIIDDDLPAGLNQSFPFDTGPLRPGFYQIGVRADDVTYLSQGTVEIQGPPSPLFIEPDMDEEVEQGDFFNIIADVGDPQGMANWRLFFVAGDAEEIDEGSLPGGQLLGQRITEGTGNGVDVDWDTRNVSIGTYKFGLSATDSGLTVSGAIQAGQADTIVTEYSEFTVEVIPTPDAAQPPTLEFTSGDQTAFGGETVDISFTGQTFEGDEYLVTIFYTFENDDEEVLIGTVTDPTATSIPFDTQDLQSGLYTIGGTIFDGRNDPVSVSQAGRPIVQVVQADESTLTVSAPGSDVQVGQGDEVSIEWSTNVPSTEEGTFRVFAQECTTDAECDADDLLNSTQIIIQAETPLSVTSADWDTSAVLGRHIIWVELDLPELTSAILARAPGVVRVSSIASQVWVGSLGMGAASRLQGEVYQGVNFQDNAGTFLNTVNDYNNDGRADFIISSRYGKPFFQNPSGVGIGESYMIFGGARQNATRNLNAVGTGLIPGVIFTGVRPRDNTQEETDGLGSVRQVPDQDGDGLPEMMFGFPYVDSRGHTYALIVRQDPSAENTLEKPRQFIRGGVVVVSSTNALLSSPNFDELPPDPDAPLDQKAVIFLDLVGQNFRRAEAGRTYSCPAGEVCNNCDQTVNCSGGDPLGDNYFVDIQELDDTMNCMPNQDGCSETYIGPWQGFNSDLSDGFADLLNVFLQPAAGTGSLCTCFGTANHAVNIPANPALQPRAQAILAGAVNDPGSPTGTVSGSAFTPLRYCNFGGIITDNEPRAPFGARIIGRGAGMAGLESTTADKFGASIAVSGGFVLVSAPNRTPGDFEVTGVPAANVPPNPGLIYMFNLNNLWIDWRTATGVDPADNIPGACQGGQFIALNLDTGAPTAPQMPYQYQIDSVDQAGRRIDLLETFPSPFLIMGEQDQLIENVESIPDFNLDNREDFAIGAPLAGSGDGAVYVAYRRDPAIEGDYLLSRFSIDPGDAERLAGLRLNGRTGAGEGFGQIIARSLTVAEQSGAVRSDGVDFNGDGLDDLIIGNPNANNGAGEVVVVFATDDLISGAGGTSLTQLLALRDDDGDPRAVIIRGAAAGDMFGFNVTVAGDFNGDGRNDLLVGAPGASPMFDSDDDGVLDTPGIDIVNEADPDSGFGDGLADDVNGDGVINVNDQLIDAGQVYLILGTTNTSNNLVDLAGPTNLPIDITDLGSAEFRGVVVVGASAGDMLGGGIEVKRQKRSFGVGPAGDVDGDARDDILLGSILADPEGRIDAGEAYLIYGFNP